jgi:hypothetical protein
VTELAVEKRESGAALDPLLHSRCCKPAVPKGLCRQGGPIREGVRIPTGASDECMVCHGIWNGGHDVECPRDSGFW